MGVCTQEMHDFQRRFTESADLMKTLELEKAVLLQKEQNASQQLAELRDQMTNVDCTLQAGRLLSSNLHQQISQLEVSDNTLYCRNSMSWFETRYLLFFGTFLLG